MYYLKEVISNCILIIQWSAMIPLMLGTLFFPFSMLGLISIADAEHGPDLFFYYVGFFLLLATVILCRIYQIFEKWDQLLSIKNQNKFLDLGYDGINLLKPNFHGSDIQKLRAIHAQKLIEENNKKSKVT